MPIPNFLIIGAHKCGTTALYATLADHPQVYMSPMKEPSFFAFDGQPPAFAGPGAGRLRYQTIISWDKYQALFAAAGDEIALGEASPLYLTSYQPEQTAENIRRRLPEVRLVAVLRQPAERAYSHFTYRFQHGNEPLRDFGQALAAEEQRIAANWHPSCRYRRNGLYCANLTPYFERFPRARIRVYLYDELNHRPQAVLTDLARFLEVDSALMPETLPRQNVTIWDRSHLVTLLLHRAPAFWALFPLRLRQKLKQRLRAWNQIKPPPLDPRLRRDLTEGYREEIVNLQSLIGQDLSHWLSEPDGARL